MEKEITVRRERAILVGCIVRTAKENDNLVELTALAESAGAIVIDRVQQKMLRPCSGTYIGKGKAEEICKRVGRYKADVVIFDSDLSPRQIAELEAIIGARVIDRSELILDIFATRAQTRQAKLQVAVAQFEYTYPRLTRMWGHLDTLTGAAGGPSAGAVGAIGTRGTGEQQLETDRRLVKKRIMELKRELVEIDQRKIREIQGRNGMFTVGLVGYTNAGKSTLLNALTGADSLVEDRLFATLDTRTKKWPIEKGVEVLLSDTVGFVRNIPHHLVASFKATLEEAIYADLLIHVVDVASKETTRQIEAVNSVLEEIGCAGKPVLMVLNKVDAIKDISHLETLQTMYPQALSISAKSGYGLDALRQAVIERFRGGQVVLEVECSLSDGKIQSFLRAKATILGEKFGNDAVTITARLGKNQLPDLKRLKPVSLNEL